MPPEILRLSFSDLAALEGEIATNLRHGRLFVADVLDAPVLSEGVVVIVHPSDGRELRLAAQIVMINGDGPMKGTGLALRGFGPSEVDELVAFARERGADGAGAQQPSEDVPAGPGEATDPSVLLGYAMPAIDEAQASDEASQLTAAENDWSEVLPERVEAPGHSVNEGHREVQTAMRADTEPSPPMAAEDDWSGVLSDEQPSDESFDEPEAEQAEADGFDAEHGFDTEPAEHAEPDVADAEGAAARPASELQQDNRLERLRSLNATEQLKVARRGELQDRVVVERLYGKQVWAALLENPRITLPEVARIARKGTVPRPLIESIVENNAWIRADNVRRALLSNPKLTGEGILKLLRITPRHELKVMEKATAYPMNVRDAVRKLLRES